MDTRIYVITHKKFTCPEDPLYHALHVGRALGNDLGYTGDDTGKHISGKNRNYCELTGIYWIWKNISCDIVGICHYRRYFTQGKQLLTQEYIERTLKDYDAITVVSGLTDQACVRDQYEHYHHIGDLNLCRTILEEKYPDYLDAFDHCMSCNLFSLGNMIITRKDIYDEYCAWLFDILFEVEKRADISEYDDYQKRIFGFLSERLIRIWLLNSSYKVKEESYSQIDEETIRNSEKVISLKLRIAEVVTRDLIADYRNKTYTNLADCSPIHTDFHGKAPVWVCLLQGLENAGEMERICINSIRRNLPADTAELHIVTMDNVGEYLTLPQWIIDRFLAGQLSPDDLVDIVCAGLLYRYGGLWISPRCYVAGPIDAAFFEQPFYTLDRSGEKWFYERISKESWSRSLMMGRAGDPLFGFLLNGLYQYWKIKNDRIDQALADYIIATAYDKLPEVRAQIDSYAKPAPHVQDLDRILHLKYDEQTMHELAKDTPFFLLSPGEELPRENVVGEETYWGALCRSLFL